MKVFHKVKLYNFKDRKMSNIIKLNLKNYWYNLSLQKEKKIKEKKRRKCEKTVEEEEMRNY